jgi:hypothetical protein
MNLSFPVSLRIFQSGINDHNFSGFRPPRAFLRFVWARPHLYRWYAKWLNGYEIFDRTFDLVFDGFPRSGNSYSIQMLTVTQEAKLKLLSHSHCPPFLLAPLELNVPVCLALRQPEDAILSWVIMRKLPVDVVLKLYIDFHQVLLPYRSQILVLNFSTITEDFPTVLRLINRRFGMTLNIPSDFDACKKEAFQRIDRHYEGQVGGYDPLKVARPHPKRDEVKDEIRQKLHHGRNAQLLTKCTELYEAFNREAIRELQALTPAPARAA